MSNYKFELNLKGGADILKRNAKLQALEKQAISSILATVSAQFEATFGHEGNFQVIPTGQGGDRINFTLKGADKKTLATLAKNPRWLAQFIDNIKI